MKPIPKRAITGVEVLFIILIIFTIVVFVICVIADIKRSKRPATIIDRSHISSSTSLGITSNGKSTVIFNPEKCELIVRDDDGNVYAIQVSAEFWADAKMGGRINDRLPEKP